MNNEIHIVMADDHPIVRQGLRQTIEADAALKIVAESGDGVTALAQIVQHGPAVAVLDVDMPGQDGFSVARAVRQQKLGVEIVFLTIHREEEVFQAALDLGAKGYVLKDSAVTDIVAAIKAVAAGDPFISPQLSSYLLKHSQSVAALNARKPGLEELTPTERRILKLVSEDKSSKEIAGELSISHRTVETHRTNISRKLELRGNLALVKFAFEHKARL